MIRFDPTPWRAPMKTVSLQEKVKQLCSLTQQDVSDSSYAFIQDTLRVRNENDSLDYLTDKQQKWFDDLYDTHFG